MTPAALTRAERALLAYATRDAQHILDTAVGAICQDRGVDPSRVAIDVTAGTIGVRGDTTPPNPDPTETPR